MGKLSGKIALVTGGNSGIGLATAKQFVAEGAYVFISGRRQSELAKAAQEIGENVTRIIQGDVSNLADLDRLFARSTRKRVASRLRRVNRPVHAIDGGASRLLLYAATRCMATPS